MIEATAAKAAIDIDKIIMAPATATPATPAVADHITGITVASGKHQSCQNNQAFFHSSPLRINPRPEVGATYSIL